MGRCAAARRGLRRQHPSSDTQGAFSHGTALSAALHIVPRGGARARAGSLVPEPLGARQRSFRLEAGASGATVPAWSFPAAELEATCFWNRTRSISTFFPGPGVPAAFRVLAWLGPWVCARFPVRHAIEFGIRRLPSGPSERRMGRITAGGANAMIVAGEARDERTGQRVSAVIKTGEGYKFTAAAALELARRVEAGDVEAGFSTPASRWGGDLVMQIPGEEVIREDT